MAQAFRITIDVAYLEGTPPVTATCVRTRLLIDLNSASFPGVIQGFTLGVEPLEDDGALLKRLTPPEGQPPDDTRG